MRHAIPLALILPLLLLTGGCTSYRMPTATNGVTLNLQPKDVDLGQEVRGSDWAFTIIPFYFFMPAIFRSQEYALGEATKSAYEMSGADFVFQPRSKVSYYNFILFDLSFADVAGRTVKVRTTERPANQP